MLHETQLTGDSVMLSWTKLDNATLTGYRILRRQSATDPATPISSYQQGTSTVFTDKAAPYAPYVEYQVAGLLSTSSSGTGNSVSSNALIIKQLDTEVIASEPFDIQFERNRRRLYLFERSGNILQYNLGSSEITKSVASGATIGYCDFATYNGIPELYVPRNDGWVFIYNAETL